MCGDVDQENTIVITKSRCPKLAGGVFPKPAKELADLLKDLWEAPAEKTVEFEAPRETRTTSVEPKKNGAVNGSVNGGGGPQTVADLTDELAAIWKRMYSPRGVAHEFDALKAPFEALAGSTGLAEYYPTNQP